ncbi:hypothetical protein [Duganella vulcania]|uniref:hypothetical protein n=1 Tax=Duganella vulcania TaxID=2692166 RepID=UPI0015831941|nr:hypothetical protein [Duganella vulcania]
MKIIPKVPELAHSALVTLGGVLIAAYILSRFPAVRDFVAGQSIRVADSSNKTLYF